MSPPSDPYDPSSYRDRRARVFYRDGEVLRGLTPTAREIWEQVNDSTFFGELSREGKVIATELLPTATESGWAAVLRHERVPIISYPYEWSFGMLQTAAILQLEIIQRALEDGFAVRDATPYNIQWFGGRPTFIDIASFEPFVAGSLWGGYRQFSELFLFPLFLQAYRRVDFHPWLRGSLDGISAAAMANLLRPRDRLRRGVLTHVDLQAKLQQRFAAAASQSVDQSVREVNSDSRTIILRNVEQLRRIVSGLSWTPETRGWLGYSDQNTYSADDKEAKERFVRRWTESIRPVTTLDIGCNTGTFSEVAAEAGGWVVAVDSDHGVIERLYRRVQSRSSSGKILPLVWDAVNPSPSLGWRGLERRPLPSRVSPDLVLALALIHHLIIGRNVPTDQVIGFLASFGAPVVVEFIDRPDPMVKHLLAQKDEEFADYSHENFRLQLGRHFEVVEVLPLPGGSRTLYFARPIANP